jgi:death on curing protein
MLASPLAPAQLAGPLAPHLPASPGQRPCPFGPALGPAFATTALPQQGPDRALPPAPRISAAEMPRHPQARARTPASAPAGGRGPAWHRKLVVIMSTHAMVAIKILTSKKILDIHEQIISNFGGIDGVLCHGTIDYLVDQINAESDLFSKAALALHTVANCHPFLDGNKRSAFQIAELILSSEGYAITAKDDEIIHMLLRIASYQCQVDEVKIWLERNTTRL